MASGWEVVSERRVPSWKYFGVKSVNTRVWGENVDCVRVTKKREEIRYLQRKCRLRRRIGREMEFGGIGEIAGFLEWNEVERSFRHVGVKTMKSTTCSENVEWG